MKSDMFLWNLEYCENMVIKILSTTSQISITCIVMTTMILTNSEILRRNFWDTPIVRLIFISRCKATWWQILQLQVWSYDNENLITTEWGSMMPSTITNRKITPYLTNFIRSSSGYSNFSGIFSISGDLERKRSSTVCGCTWEKTGADILRFCCERKCGGCSRYCWGDPPGLITWPEICKLAISKQLKRKSSKCTHSYTDNIILRKSLIRITK